MDRLLDLRYECLIVDEAHRARRNNKGESNQVLRFLNELAPRAHSVLLATATPVQLEPSEAWDLLSVLAQGNEAVLGNTWSRWRRPDDALQVVTGERLLSDDDAEAWQWIRNPLPRAEDGRDFGLLRAALGTDDSKAVASCDLLDRLDGPERSRLQRVARNFGERHNPFIRRIVRRTRDYLENTVDPESGEPYLKKVEVQLFGEAEADAIAMPPYMKDSYDIAENFCRSVAARAPSGTFLKTLLLRRLGSTIHAGVETARRLLGEWTDIDELDDEDDFNHGDASQVRALTAEERTQLEHFVATLESNVDRDPK